MARVVLEHLGKVFKGPQGEPVQAVKDVSLVVEDKEFLVVVGPSGCGKSTTLRLIAGLEEISSGTVSINGRVMNDVPPKDRDIAMVFQHHALFPHMTAFENMAFGLRLRKVPPPEIERRVREAAGTLGLAPLLDRRPSALSLGQRQRVAVGRALVRQPQVFLFDEPLSSLDARMREQMRAEISRLHARLGATMIYVTHDQAEAMTMGDRIVVMNAGAIQQAGDPLTVYHKPASLFVAGFIGSPPMNFFPGTISAASDGLVFIAEDSGAAPLAVGEAQAGALQGYVGEKIILGLRPENIFLAAQNPLLANTVTAQINVVEPLGSETLLHCSAGPDAFIVKVSAQVKWEVNRPLALRFDLNKARYFDPATERAIV